MAATIEMDERPPVCDSDPAAPAPAGAKQQALHRLRSFLGSPARRRQAVEGLALGILIGLCIGQLGISALIPIDVLQDTIVIPAVLGTALALSPLRGVLRIAAAAAMVLLLIVAYTPITSVLMPGLEHRDPLRAAPAIAVLSGQVLRDGTINASGQARVDYAFLLLRQGYSDRLIVTRGVASVGREPPVIREQMRLLGLNYPADEVGPVADTHDEAVKISRLARQRGWKSVILVTQPWHMRRARALFIKAGLAVVCAPCAENTYDLHKLDGAGVRCRAFRDWLHETIGLLIYRLRGWV